MLKTISGLLVIISFTFLNTGCKKAIEVNEIGGTSASTILRNDADIAALLNSAYFAMAHDDYYGGSYQVYNELLADHLDGTTLGGNYLGIYTRNTNIFNGDNSSFYAQIYKIVFQANLTLDNLNLADAGNKTKYEGHAKFLRALAFFDLVRMYAQPYSANASTLPGIPLRLNSTRQQVQRSTVAEVYQQIINDLKEAETKLPGVNGVYATNWAAKALLAKVYFQMNDFVNALQYADDVIENGPYDFDSEILNRFSSEGSSEIIFGLVTEASNPQGRFQRLRGNYNTLNASLPTLRLTSSFYNRAIANPTDVRREWYSTTNGFYLLGKFDSASIIMPVIHLTELLLIRAESAAENATNLMGAIMDLNLIIDRAYGAGSSLMLPNNANATEIIQAARRERELELVGEGNRLQELKRIGAKGENVTIRGSVYNCPGLILPFPNNEVIYSPLMVQNPIGGCN